jgi:beta-lactamase superfamily II metal-dependent hydrolase
MKNAQCGNGAESVTFFCQVDTYLGMKDYLRGGRCVRLIGVSESDFSRLRQQDVSDGVTSFVLDVDLAEFVRNLQSTLWSRRRDELSQVLAAWEKDALGDRSWLRVEIEADALGMSYLYATFSAAAPKHFKLLNVVRVVGPDLGPLLMKPPRGSTRMLFSSRSGRFKVAPMPIEIKGTPPYRFSAFHVGQGMCSAAYNDSHAVLFDAGAGTPVTRKRYLTETSFKSDLKTLVQPRTVPYLVLSHYDHDHWRLLAWDEDLRHKVGKVIVPDVPGISVAFFDAKLVGKVYKWDSLRIKLGSSGEVSSKRSKPKLSDANGECLVSLVTLGGRKALVPGDYVYQRMASDGETWIAGLRSLQYSAVIVPHHGDEASALSVPTAQAGANAFFSAGNHKGYGHPATSSEKAHLKAGFKTLMDRYQQDIVEVSLL